MTDKAINNPSIRYLLSHPPQWLAFGFGAGLAPKAPGTFGTLAAIPFYWLFQDWGWVAYAILLVVTTVVGIYLCGVTAKALKTHDHPGIVWDEMVGYWLTMALAPAGWVWWLVGFVLFRLFDIVKPWPIGWLDKRVKGGWGIMLDDLVAGLMAWVCLQLLGVLWNGLMSGTA